MVLQNHNSHGVSSDLFTGKEKRFIFERPSKNSRSGTNTRSQLKSNSQRFVMPDSNCKAQQRLINLTKSSKINDLQPKLPLDISIQKKSVDFKPNFIFQVQSYEHIDTTKTSKKSRNPVRQRECNEYNPKGPLSDDDNGLTVNKSIINGNKKEVNENGIKEKYVNATQSRKDPYVSTVFNINKRGPFNYKDSTYFDNFFMETIEKRAYSSSGNNLPCHSVNNTNSDLTDNTWKRFQEWCIKNDRSVSRAHTGYNQGMTGNRSLKISEALELHEIENESDFIHKTDSNGKTNASIDRSINEGKLIKKFSNLKISEFHDDFIVEKIKNTGKSSSNICLKDETDWNDQILSEDFHTDDKISMLYSSEDDSPKTTELKKNSFSRFECGSFRDRNSSDGYQKISINSRKDNLQNFPTKFSTGKCDKDFQSEKSISKTEQNPDTNGSLHKSYRTDTYHSHKFSSWTGFGSKQLVKKDDFGVSCLSSNVNSTPFVKNSPLPYKNLFKEYNTSHQQRLKYAKSCSNFNTLMKSSFKSPAGRDKNENSSCLAQQRLLSLKPLNT